MIIAVFIPGDDSEQPLTNHLVDGMGGIRSAVVKTFRKPSGKLLPLIKVPDRNQPDIAAHHARRRLDHDWPIDHSLEHQLLNTLRIRAQPP